MRNIWANLNVCKVMTGKHLCLSLFIKKVAGWSPATIFKWGSGTVTFLWILLNFTEHLFAEHLRKAVSVVFFKFYFFLCKELQDREDNEETSASATMQMLINLRKTLLNSAWCAKTFIFMKQQLLVFCSAKYSSSCIVFIVFSA